MKQRTTLFFAMVFLFVFAFSMVVTVQTATATLSRCCYIPANGGCSAGSGVWDQGVCRCTEFLPNCVSACPQCW